MLDKQRFSSIRESAKLTGIPPTTIYRRITKSLGSLVKHLPWVPDDFTQTQKPQRISISNQLLRKIRSVKPQGWHFVIIPVESSFTAGTDHDQVWLRAHQEPPERPKDVIQDKRSVTRKT
jgi:predicted DNA-binding transcriptional regulator AlpA